MIVTATNDFSTEASPWVDLEEMEVNITPELKQAVEKLVPIFKEYPFIQSVGLGRFKGLLRFDSQPSLQLPNKYYNEVFVHSPPEDAKEVVVIVTLYDKHTDAENSDFSFFVPIDKSIVPNPNEEVRKVYAFGYAETLKEYGFWSDDQRAFYHLTVHDWVKKGEKFLQVVSVDHEKQLAILEENSPVLFSDIHEVKRGDV